MGLTQSWENIENNSSKQLPAPIFTVMNANCQATGPGLGLGTGIGDWEVHAIRKAIL